MLEVIKLTKSYLDPKNTNSFILKDINFKLEKGEALGIIGKNGAGKSTLLKLLSGVLKPTGGEIKIYGNHLSILDVSAGFHEDLTGIENVFLKSSLLGISKKEIKKKLLEISEFSELGDKLNQKVSSYSDGMRLRLAFSTFLFSEVDLLILDEVLFVGDLNFSIKSFDKLKSFRDQGKSIVIAGHDISKMSEICDRGLYLIDGKEKFFGSFGECKELYVEESVKKIEIPQYKLPIEKDAFDIISISFSKSSIERTIELTSSQKTLNIYIKYLTKANLSDFGVGLVISNTFSDLITDSPLFSKNNFECKMGLQNEIVEVDLKYFTGGHYWISFFIGQKGSQGVFLGKFLKLFKPYNDQIKAWNEENPFPPLNISLKWHKV